jgi:hypothetical protein
MATIEFEIQNPRFRGAYRAACTHRKLEGLMEAYSHLSRSVRRGDRMEYRVGSSAEIQQALSLRSQPLIVREPLPALVKSGVSLGNPKTQRSRHKPDATWQPARTDMLLYQLFGRRRLQLVPWYEFVAVADLTGTPANPGHRDLCVLDVSVEASEALVLPVGWWYGSVGQDEGLTVTFEVARAGDRGATWRKARLTRMTSRPPPDGAAI